MKDEDKTKEKLLAELLELRCRNTEMEALVSDYKEAELRHQKSEERLELALKGANLGLWDYNLQTGEAFISDRRAEMVGYSVDELEPHISSWGRMVHPDDVHRVRRAFNAYIKGETPLYESEHRLRCKSGDYIWVLAQAKVVERDADGNPVRITGTSLDITERKQSEKALRQSEEFNRRLVEHSPMAIVYLSAEGIIEYTNPASNRMFDVPEGQESPLLGFKIFDLPLMTEQPHINETFRRLMEGMPLSNIEFVYRSPLTHRDFVLLASATPGLTPDGSISGVIVMFMDITERKQAEEALRKSERLFRAIFEQAAVGVAQIVTSTGEVVRINQRYCDIVGYTGEEMGRQPFQEITHPDDLQPDLNNIELLLEGKIREYSIEKRYYHKNGAIVWVNLTVSPMWQAGEEPGFHIAVAEEITARQHAQDKLSEAERKYRRLFDESRDGIYITTRDGSLADANQSFLDLFGYTEPEMKNMNIADTYVNPADRVEFRKTIEGQGYVTDYPISLRRKSGQHMDCLITATVHLDKDGSVLEYQGSIRHVTEQKRAERALKVMESAVESSISAIGITDLQGKLLYVNDSLVNMWGYDNKDEVLGRRLPEFWEGEGVQNTVAELRKKGVSVGEDVGRRKDGSLFSAEFSATMLHDEAGAPMYMYGSFVDITVRKRLEEQVRQAVKMEAVGTLAGGVAHDFNNLLQVVLGYADLLLLDKECPQESQGKLHVIKDAAKRGRDLVDSILTFSRKARTNPRPVDLNHEVRQAEKLLSRTIPKMIEIELVLSDDLMAISADPGQIEQVLLNLAVNANDAMPDGGRLVIETQNITLDEQYCEVHVDAEPGKHVLLMVSDTGHGMGQEDLSRVFEPFFTTKEPGEGTGLGLAMVYGIVKAHRGHIICYSEPSTGTTFKIFLPVMDVVTEPDMAMSAEMLAFGTETILLVDDEDQIRGLGKEMLGTAGYTVLTACNGQEALELYRKKQPDISSIVLDLIMPEMGGDVCLDELLKFDPNAKVVVASGLSAHRPTKQAIQARAKGFIGKPFETKELLRIVRKVLDMG